MQDIKQREEKIKQKRMQTPWRKFVKEVCSWRNLVFYRNDIGISKYSQKTNRKMNLIDLNQARKNNPCDILFQLDYDKNKSFFSHWKIMYNKQPMGVVNHYGIQENADRGDEVRGAKNVYLSVAVGDEAENVLYTFKGESHVRNIISCVNITQYCENIYYSRTINKSFNIFYSKFIYNSANIRFSDNLIGCKECVLCDNLENKSYYIENKEHTKETYLLKKEEILKQKNKFNSFYNNLSVFGAIRLCDNVLGHTLYNCHDVENAYELSNIDRARNILYCDGGSDSSDCYDVIDSATDRTHNLYAVMGQAFGDNIYCSGNTVESSNIYYSFMLQNCNYCIGCIGLTGKSYCVFNKQYTKEERFKLANEIFSQMDVEGVLGDFFPASMNPFYFNDTAAYLIDDSFTKEEVEAEGYLRRDEEIKVDIPEGQETIKTTELNQYQGFDSEGKRTIDPSILKKVIIDEKGNYYRIVKMEYDFLMKHGLPLPEIHWLDRIKLGFKFR